MDGIPVTESGKISPRQRVQAALNKQHVDRVPVFMWYHPRTLHRLSRLLEVPVSQVSLAMGDDIRQTWVNNNVSLEAMAIPEGESQRDAWGISWARFGDFNQIETYPLLSASDAELSAASFPYEHVEELLAPMIEINRLKDAYFTGCDISPCVFEMYWRLRGHEQSMYDMISKTAGTLNLLDHSTDFSIFLAEAATKRFSLDWIWTGDDAGSQQNMLISPAMWRDLIKPRLKRIFDVIHNLGLPVAFHSCGAIRQVIPDLIEIGMNVLNPVQGNCPGMNPLELKKEFGDKITFMGGVDTQELLPKASATDVFRESVSLIEGMTADGGGYILAASHTIPPETPDENIFALYRAAGISQEEIMDRAAGIRATDQNKPSHVAPRCE